MNRFVLSEVLIGLIKNFLDEYEWKYDNCSLTPDEELVIYEIHVGDFSGGENDPHARGQFKYVREKIDYLKELGVNASMDFLFIQIFGLKKNKNNIFI